MATFRSVTDKDYGFCGIGADSIIADDACVILESGERKSVRIGITGEGEETCIEVLFPEGEGELWQWLYDSPSTLFQFMTRTVNNALSLSWMRNNGFRRKA